MVEQAEDAAIHFEEKLKLDKESQKIVDDLFESATDVRNELMKEAGLKN